MNKPEEVLIQVARLAQKAGILSLEDAATTLTAIKLVEGKLNATDKIKKQESVSEEPKNGTESGETKETGTSDSV